LNSGSIVPAITTPPGVNPPTVNISSGLIVTTSDGVDLESSNNVGETVFTQPSGVSILTSSLLIAQAAASNDAYNLSGSSLSCGGESIGGEGTASFTQTGGSNTYSTLYLGFSGGAIGTYMLSSGTLSAPLGTDYFERLGFESGVGNFIQTGGINQTGLLYIGLRDGYYSNPAIELYPVGVGSTQDNV
jgi:hypothetical protein